VLEFLQETWENFVKLDKFDEVADGINAGLSNLSKWYHKTDETDAYFISLSMFGFLCQLVHFRHLSPALDPNYKLAYAEATWDPEFYRAAYKNLEDVVSANTYPIRQG
jgi:hypothetical protein